MTPQEGRDLFSRGVLKFNTAVGTFSLPKVLIQAHYIDKLSNLLEESVKLELDKEQFIQRLCQELPLIPEQDNRDIEVVSNLYENLLALQRQGVNGIWARIIKNSFAPLFAGEFDYVAGNPPWVNWKTCLRTIETIQNLYGKSTVYFLTAAWILSLVKVRRIFLC